MVMEDLEGVRATVAAVAALYYARGCRVGHDSIDRGCLSQATLLAVFTVDDHGRRKLTSPPPTDLLVFAASFLECLSISMYLSSFLCV